MITGNFLFPTQIVVMKQLDSKLHFWLSNLRKNIPEQIFRDVIIKIHAFNTKQEKEYAKAYFGALAEYNKQIHAKAKEDSIMNEYMQEFYKAEIDAKVEAEKKANVIGMLNEGLNLDVIARVSRLTIEQVTTIGKQAMLL